MTPRGLPDAFIAVCVLISDVHVYDEATGGTTRGEFGDVLRLKPDDAAFLVALRQVRYLDER